MRDHWAEHHCVTSESLVSRESEFEPPIQTDDELHGDVSMQVLMFHETTIDRPTRSKMKLAVPKIQVR